MSTLTVPIWLLAATTFVSYQTKPTTTPAEQRPVAETLFEKGQWAASRKIFDGIAQSKSHYKLRRRAIEQSVVCSIKLSDWEAALQSVRECKKRRPQPTQYKPSWFNFGRWHKTDRKNWQADLDHLEFARELLHRIANAATTAPRRFRATLDTARIQLAFELIQILDVQMADSSKYTILQGHSWWWEHRLTTALESESFPIPVTATGDRYYPKPPNRYDAQLGRGRNVRIRRKGARCCTRDKYCIGPKGPLRSNTCLVR